MQRYIIFVLVIAVAVAFDVQQAQSTNDTALSAVYRLEIRGCAYEPTVPRQQTGFRVRGLTGIVTILHGLADCTEINAIADDGQIIFSQLAITQVDFVHDVVLLSSPALAKETTSGLLISTLSDIKLLTENMQLVGYPVGIEEQTIEEVTGIVARESLDESIPDEQESVDLIKRKSPDLQITVLQIDRQLQPGQTGAPLLDSQGRVVGVGHGGLRDSETPSNWAIPWQDIQFKPIDQAGVRAQLLDLQQRDPTLAFAFSRTFASGAREAAAVLAYSVHVTDETNMPIANAEVTLLHSDGYEIGYTDSEGIALFQLSKSLDYQQGELSVEAEGFATYDGKLNASEVQEGYSTILLTKETKTATVPPRAPSNSLCSFAFRVLDHETEQPLAKATIYTTLGTHQDTGDTDSTGYYASQLPCDHQQNNQIRIRVVATGYQPHSETVQLIDELKEIALMPLRITPATATPSPTVQVEQTALFHLGDWVLAVPTLRIRAEPGLQADIRETLARQETFVIHGGPVQADGYIWWQLQEIDGTLRGWAAFVVDGEEVSLTLAPYQTPTPPSVVVATPTTTGGTPVKQASAFIEILDPKWGDSRQGWQTVRWRYNGQLQPGQGFDLILWYILEDRKRGVTDARIIAEKLEKHGNGDYSVLVNFSAAEAVKQYCDAKYLFAVTVVEIDPYKRIGPQSDAVQIQVAPLPGGPCG